MNQAAEYVLNFKLEEGEMICNKCDGGGSFPKKFASVKDPHFLNCPKCQGKGIVDWIENIVGSKPFIASDSSAVFNNIPQAALCRASQQFSNKIDQEIMESLVKQSEQNNKMKAAAILYEIGRVNF